MVPASVAIVRRRDFPKARSETAMAEHISTGRNGVKAKPHLPAADVELERIREAVRGIQFGEVRIVIQDGLVVQIERLEKQRLR
jgi:hypothetical protein